MADNQHRADKMCWSVFSATSSTISIAGLLLYIAGINYGAILLSFGIQVLVISFLFYCWARCLRQIKTELKLPLWDPPPPYNNEWRLAFISSVGLSETSVKSNTSFGHQLKQIKFFGTSSSESNPSVDVGISSTAVADGETQMHAHESGDCDIVVEETVVQKNRRIPCRISGTERSSINQPSKSCMSDIYRVNLGLPSYEEAMAQSQLAQVHRQVQHHALMHQQVQVHQEHTQSQLGQVHRQVQHHALVHQQVQVHQEHAQPQTPRTQNKLKSFKNITNK